MNTLQTSELYVFKWMNFTVCDAHLNIAILKKPNLFMNYFVEHFFIPLFCFPAVP